VEDLKVHSDDVLGPINWEFIRIVAIIELYTKERWIEPIYPHAHAYSLLYHQTMSHLKGSGELSAAALASAVLTLGCFSEISQEDYRSLLGHLISIGQLERTERGGLAIGREGEKAVNSHKFLTVFLAPEYLLVKDENRTIGTVDKAYPVGVRFALAGQAWETVDLNEKSKVIFVKRVPGISVVDWDVDFDVELHTKLVQKMKSVLEGDEDYPYLSGRCKERLAEIRYIAANSGILENLATPVSDKKYAVFPWVGTRQLLTLHYALLGRKIKSRLPWITCVYLEVQFEGTAEELEGAIMDILYSRLDLYQLPIPEKAQVKGKYNEFVPQRLLAKQFVEDFLDFEGLAGALCEKE
jgi:ATP-dependent Lhr-like helicase